METNLKKIILDEKHPAISHLVRKDKRLAKVISTIGPLEYTIHDDPYSFLIHEIIEQMLSVKAGNKIYSRLVDLCNGFISPKSIMLLSDEQIKSIGTATSKVSFIRALTDAVISKELDFSELESLSNNDVIEKLTKIKGIGSWTASMYLIFVLDRQDILPINDVAFLQAYKWLYKTNDISKSSIQNRCRKWKPYSSVAARYLYRALDAGLTKEEFHLYK